MLRRRHMYLDFPNTACNVGGAEKSGFGCDSLGCYGYPPIDETNVDFGRYPRLADIQLVTAEIHAGDALFIPALWFHRVEHLPREALGRNIALTYTQQRTWRGIAGTKPFSEEIVNSIQRQDQGVFEPGYSAVPQGTPGTPDKRDEL